MKDYSIFIRGSVFVDKSDSLVLWIIAAWFYLSGFFCIALSCSELPSISLQVAELLFQFMSLKCFWIRGSSHSKGLVYFLVLGYWGTSVSDLIGQ